MSAARPLGAHTYQRHQPEHTVLYKIAEENLETFLRLVQEECGRRLPDFVEKEFRDTFTTGDSPSQMEVQKLGTTYKQLAQEIESIYGWVMNVNFGVGHVINYNRTWPEITSMINPDHLDEMIDRLTYDLALLVSIQTRMTDLDKGSQTGTASPIKTINTIFYQTNIVNYVQFTESLIENLEVIRHALKVHHQSPLVPSKSEDITVYNEMGRVSSRLRELPALLQKPSPSHFSHR
ncbi:MAG: hypothetical protein IPJ71_10975 [Bdellovibrionales bacterium]|nr:hypothetical protein [Bdellovibrionales bacterium]